MGNPEAWTKDWIDRLNAPHLDEAEEILEVCEFAREAVDPEAPQMIELRRLADQLNKARNEMSQAIVRILFQFSQKLPRPAWVSMGPDGKGEEWALCWTGDKVMVERRGPTGKRVYWQELRGTPLEVRMLSVNFLLNLFEATQNGPASQGSVQGSDGPE